MQRTNEMTTHSGGIGMDAEQAEELGRRIALAREALGISKRELSRRTGVSDGTIVRIEQGQFANPAPDKLARIANELGLELADVFALAGYAAPAQLPAWRPYLRAKYGELPTAAVNELESFFDYLKSKYGADVDGPERGEDEMTAEEWQERPSRSGRTRGDASSQNEEGRGTKRT